MSTMQEGDILLRGSVENGFAVLDALTERVVVVGPLPLPLALECARALAPRTIWEQVLDHRGRPLSAPLRLVNCAET